MSRRRGLTLIELVLALGLFALLMLAAFRLLDRTLFMWRRAETRRNVLAQAAAITDLFARDVRSLDGGARGDCVAEWVTFDTDGDAIAETKWPRIRLVRQASAHDIARLREQERAEQGGSAVDDEAPLETVRPALVEVVWLVVPASLVDPGARAEGVLWRGERRVGDRTTKSFFAPDFFGTSNRPPAGATHEVSGGVLWMQLLFAGQTTTLDGSWTLSSELAGASAAWDAWSRARPSPDFHAWNEPGAGVPKARATPVLPRRVRIELEIERPQDRLRRTVLAEAIEMGDSALAVDDGERVPRGEDVFVLVDAEWMKVTSIDGKHVAVTRAQRGTLAKSHARGALVHFGERLVREVPIAMYKEDWNL
ncbi:MAG: type II secretion system protein J [Planctomycetota bacterium]